MSTSLLVGNLPIDTTEESLLDYFGQCGRVKSVTLVRTDKGQTRGFAVVIMSSRQEAVDASNALADQEFSGRKISVSLRKESIKNSSFSLFKLFK